METRSRLEPKQINVVCGAAELDRSHDEAPLHAPLERLQPRLENHMAAVAINYFAYTFLKIHSTIRMTPAMAAGVSTRLMDVSDLVKLLIESEAEKAARRSGAYPEPAAASCGSTPPRG
jgi:hypothetical protein